MQNSDFSNSCSDYNKAATAREWPGGLRQKAPLAIARGAQKQDVSRDSLEGELGRQLNPARAAAAQERVSYAHVASSRDGRTTQAHFTVPTDRKAVDPRIGNERGQERIRKVRVIQHIEEFGAKLHLQPLGDRCVLIDREVPLFEGRSVKSIAAKVAIMPRVECAIGSKARRRRLRGRCDRAGDREGTQLHVI